MASPLEFLAEADPVMGGLIAAAGGYAPRRGLDSTFHALARAIAHQQLHGRAAQAILGRLETHFGGRFPRPDELEALAAAELRRIGFSGSKIAALKDLARKSLDGTVPEPDVLARLSDADIIERLTQVRGIGRWTVEMLLIFELGRPDVLPVDDFGVRNGFRLAYGLRRMPRPRALAGYGERWSPYRSVAAWYLWRAVELARAGTLPTPAIRVRLPRQKRRRAAAQRKGRATPARRGTTTRRTSARHGAPARRSRRRSRAAQ